MAVQEKMPWQLSVVRVVSPFRLLMNSTIMKKHDFLHTKNAIEQGKCKLKPLVYNCLY